MTYNHDLERHKVTGSGLGDYQTNQYGNTGSSKWLLISLAIIVALIGAAALFSGEAPVTNTDGAATNGQVESIQPAAPATDGNEETGTTAPAPATGTEQ